MLCTLIGAIILSINIHVGLDMHLYDDIGDASSSLQGSTSSFNLLCPVIKYQKYISLEYMLIHDMSRTNIAYTSFSDLLNC